MLTVDEYAQLSACEIAERVAARTLRAREVVEACFARIAQVNAELNAFTVIRCDEALAEADALDAELDVALAAQGAQVRRAVSGKKIQESAGGVERLPLLGVPVAVKEEYDVTGLPTTLGGWGNSMPVMQDSEAIRRIREAGAIIVGKTTMPEFGQFTDTVSQRYGVTVNPHDHAYSAGGSSGGSAVAVASGMVPVALAADGGGSIRIPASCCGVVGLKPARGRVSPAPLKEHWFGLVTLGAVTRTVADTARVNDVLAGSKPSDRFAAPPLLVSHEAGLDSARFGADGRGDRLRIVWTDRPAVAGIRTSREVLSVLERTVELLSGMGHSVRRTGRSWPVATVPFFVQFAAGMAVEAASVEEPEKLEARTRFVARLGRWVGRKMVDRAVVASEKIGRMIDQRFFGDADVLVLPTMPITVPQVGVVEGKSAIGALLATSPSVANTALFNVSGHPAISVPGPVGEGQLPVGIQLVVRPGNEHLLVALAAEIEKLILQ